MDLDKPVPPRRWLLVLAGIAIFIAWDFGQRVASGGPSAVSGWSGAAAGFAIFAGLCLVALSILEGAERIVWTTRDRP